MAGIVYPAPINLIAYIQKPSPSEGLGVARPAIEDARKSLELAPEECVGSYTIVAPLNAKVLDYLERFTVQ